jgi:galactonate dehydratase
MIQEGVRAYYRGWYRDVVTELPAVADGFVAPSAAPGLGTRLQPDFLSRPGVTVRASEL